MSWKTRFKTHFRSPGEKTATPSGGAGSYALDVLDMEDRVKYSAVPIDLAGLAAALDASDAATGAEQASHELDDAITVFLEDSTTSQQEVDSSNDAEPLTRESSSDTVSGVSKLESTQGNEEARLSLGSPLEANDGPPETFAFDETMMRQVFSSSATRISIPMQPTKRQSLQPQLWRRWRRVER